MRGRRDGDIIPIYRRENLYYVKMWIRHDKDGGKDKPALRQADPAPDDGPDFQRQGR